MLWRLTGATAMKRTIEPVPGPPGPGRTIASCANQSSRRAAALRSGTWRTREGESTSEDSDDEPAGEASTVTATLTQESIRSGSSRTAPDPLTQVGAWTRFHEHARCTRLTLERGRQGGVAHTAGVTLACSQTACATNTLPLLRHA